jgi:hypothetical protein
MELYNAFEIKQQTQELESYYNLITEQQICAAIAQQVALGSYECEITQTVDDSIVNNLKYLGYNVTTKTNNQDQIITVINWKEIGSLTVDKDVIEVTDNNSETLDVSNTAPSIEA